MKLTPLIQYQFSERIRTQFPEFVAFVELYYKFTELKGNAVQTVLEHTKNIDIDTTLDSYVDKFYTTYAAELPKTIAYDKRNLIKILNQLYNSKGTELSYKLLFRVLYNVPIELYAPRDRIVTSSDGSWFSESYITVKKSVGDFSLLPTSYLIVSNNNYTFRLLISRYESLSADIARLYYNSTYKITVYDNSVISLYNTSNVLIFRGYVKKSLSRLSVIDSGSKFRIGYVYSIPGTVSNTVLQITNVAKEGKLTHCDIVNFGHEHSTIVEPKLSPYNTAPLSYSCSISSDVPNQINLAINDTVYDITENIGIYSNGVGENVFLTYIEPVTIHGYKILDYSIGNILYSKNSLPENISVTSFYNSLASVRITSDNYTKQRGYYTDDRQVLDSAYGVTQDNNYFQIFSYSLITTLDSSVYKEFIDKSFKTAGTKLFYTINKIDIINVISSIDVTTTKFLKLRNDDSLSVVDSMQKSINFSISESTNSNIQYGESYFAENYNFESSFKDSVTSVLQ